jgi:glycosyltransferase involved in cell wall biosynthesis
VIDPVGDYGGRWTYHHVADTLWHNPAGLRPLVESFKADCVVGVTTTACAVAAEVIGDLPFWCDLYGSIMAEAQLKALVYGDDSHLNHFFAFERKAIDRGDIFSSVSERQGWALIGELGLWGRLNQWTSGYEFVHTIPIASETEPYQSKRKVIRDVLADEDTFVILYSGGYNTWTDVDTLFEALERVFDAHPDALFVSTGGKIEGHDDVTYARFQRLTAGSRHAKRYQLCGWVPNEDVPAYYLESNLAINVDRPSYEALLGSRTRILDWLRAGLPSISSDLTELARDVKSAGAGFTYRPGDVEGLAQLIQMGYENRGKLLEMSSAAQALLLARFTYEATTPELKKWVSNPAHAPDYGKNVPRLVMPAQGVGTGIAQAIERRRLGLGLAVQLWPLVARVTDALGMRSLQKRLHRWGLHLLRLDRPPYKVDWLSVEIPNTMTPGMLYTCPVRVRNDGTTPWPPSEGDKGFFLSYHWRDESGILVRKEGKRTPLPSLVRGGASLQLNMRIEAPPISGTFVLELDMVREGVTWFSEAGAECKPITITVE